MKPYPKYKDSGIEWLGVVPEGWSVKSVWHIFSLGRGRVISHEFIMDNPGDYPVYSSQTEDHGILGYLDSFDFEGDYITWTTDGANAGTVFRRLGKFNCTNVCGTLKAKYDGLTDNAFMAYSLSNATAEFVRYDINPKLMNNVMASIKVPCPSIIEQHAIASFLDRETARIDALISKKERMIELLKEKRIALITQAVTKGLDPNAKMKDSGIEWLGEVPEHWKTTKVGFGYSIQLGKMLQPEPDKPSDIPVKYLKAVNVQWDEITVDEDSLMWASINDLSKYRIQCGDLLVCEGGEAGRAAMLEFEVGDLIIQNALHRVRSSKNNVRYLQFLLQVASNHGWFDIVCNKATIAHFTRDKFSALQIPYPPITEQDLIVRHIQHLCQNTKLTIAKIIDSITFLREYRSSLIHSAVTGKIDLRDYHD